MRIPFHIQVAVIVILPFKVSKTEEYLPRINGHHRNYDIYARYVECL